MCFCTGIEEGAGSDGADEVMEGVDAGIELRHRRQRRDRGRWFDSPVASYRRVPGSTGVVVWKLLSTASKPAG